jgi:hypothetical protein
MRWYAVAAPAAVAVLFLAATAAFSEQEAIPDWVRNSAGWWAEGLISDAEYVSSLQWLADAGYINLGGDIEEQRLVRDGKYSIEKPGDWDRQVPVWDEATGGIRDSIIKLETIDNRIPAIISVSSGGMLGENITEHREVGLALLEEYLGDAFDHTLAAEADVVGNAGYVDEYTVTVFGWVIQGKSYSFEHEGQIYEIKYESGADTFPDHLAEFERIAQTLRLE